MQEFTSGSAKYFGRILQSIQSASAALIVKKLPITKARAVALVTNLIEDENELLQLLLSNVLQAFDEYDYYAPQKDTEKGQKKGAPFNPRRFLLCT